MGEVGQQRQTPVELTMNPPLGHRESQRGSGAHRPAPGAAAAGEATACVPPNASAPMTGAASRTVRQR